DSTRSAAAGFLSQEHEPTALSGSMHEFGPRVFSAHGDFALVAAASPGQTAQHKAGSGPQNADPHSITNYGMFSPSPAFTPGDNLFSSQWHLQNTAIGIGNIQLIWDQYTGAGVHVGIYDEGIQSDHYDLNNNYDASRHLMIDSAIDNGGVVDAFYDIH